MPYIFKHRRPPASWNHHKRRVKRKALMPLAACEWAAEWTAYVLSQSSILEVMEYAGSLSIIVGVIFYFAGAGDRREQKHYQAWQVINTAHGKGGSGGRIDALQELNADDVPLVGVDVSSAFLQGLKLPHADLHRCNMNAADLRSADLSNSNLEDSNLQWANFRGGDLNGADLARADLDNADLNCVDLHNADLTKVNLESADLRGANLSGILNWRAIDSMNMADISGVKGAPDGFVAWAKSQGAVDAASDDEWQKLLQGQTIRISADISLTQPLNEIAQQFTRDTGNKADINYGSSSALASQIQQGTTGDVFISADSKQIEELISKFNADESSRIDVAGNELVLIVPRNSTNTSATFADLKDPKFAHIAVGNPKTVPAGEFALQTLKSLGLSRSISSRLVLSENPRQILSRVIRGQVDAGIVYATEARAAGDSVHVTAIASAKLHGPIQYSAVILTKTSQENVASEFLDYLHEAKARAIFQKYGFTLPPIPATQPQN